MGSGLIGFGLWALGSQVTAFRDVTRDAAQSLKPEA